MYMSVILTVIPTLRHISTRKTAPGGDCVKQFRRITLISFLSFQVLSSATKVNFELMQMEKFIGYFKATIRAFQYGEQKDLVPGRVHNF